MECIADAEVLDSSPYWQGRQPEVLYNVIVERSGAEAMSMSTIRVQVDAELARRVGTWFTVRDIQDKLKINPSTLKPLMMKYARESVLRRRPVKGTARSVEFSPAAHSPMAFQELVLDAMPYRSAITVKEAVRAAEQKTAARKKAASKSAAKRRAGKR